MFGPIYIVGLSILFHSTCPTSSRGLRYCNGKGEGHEIYFCVAYQTREKKSAVTFIMDHIFTNV